MNISLHRHSEWKKIMLILSHSIMRLKWEKKVNTMMMRGIFIESDSRENAAWDEKCYKQTT